MILKLLHVAFRKKAESKGASPLSAGDVTNDLSHVRKIIVACDAGMGSSAMGAGVLRKKIQDAGLSQISVTNSAINNLPPDVDRSSLTVT